MTSTIVATVGDPGANSYVTSAEATTYFADRLHKTAWSGASASEKAAALIWATKVVDSRMVWNGHRASQTQALSWPRMYAPNPDPAYIPYITQIGGHNVADYLPADQIPLDIKNAQCEMALALISGDITAEPGATGLNSLAVGSLRLDFAGNAAQPSTFPRQVDELLVKYGMPRATKKTARKLVRS